MTKWTDPTGAASPRAQVARGMLATGRAIARDNAMALVLAVTASRSHGTAVGRNAHADLVALLESGYAANCVIAYVNAQAEADRRKR